MIRFSLVIFSLSVFRQSRSQSIYLFCSFYSVSDSLFTFQVYINTKKNEGPTQWSVCIAKPTKLMKPEKGKRTMDSIAPLPCTLLHTHSHTYMHTHDVRLFLRLRIIIYVNTEHWTYYMATIQMVSWQTNASVKWAFKPNVYRHMKKKKSRKQKTSSNPTWTLDFWFYDFMFCETIKSKNEEEKDKRL